VGVGLGFRVFGAARGDWQGETFCARMESLVAGREEVQSLAASLAAITAALDSWPILRERKMIRQVVPNTRDTTSRAATRLWMQLLSIERTLPSTSLHPYGRISRSCV
jgi:hypothetical protein